MTRSLAVLVMIVTMFAAGCGTGGTEAQPPSNSSQAGDMADVRAILDRYVMAVNDADENGLRELWAQPDDVSYVNPLQRLGSWGELQGFWQGFLQKSFTRRELKPSNVAIRVVGDAAWAVLDWDFSATQADGTPYQSSGWETQVFRRTDRGWRLAHVHYSVPATAPAAGGQSGQ